MKKPLYFLSGTIFASVLVAGVWAHADGSAQSTNQNNPSMTQSSQQAAGTLSFDQIKHLEFKWECADNKWIGSYQKDSAHVQAAIESHLNGNVKQLTGDQAVASLRHLFDQLPMNPELAQDRLVKQFSPDLLVTAGNMGLQIDWMDGRHAEYHFKDGKLVSFNQNGTGNSPEQSKDSEDQAIVPNNGQGNPNPQGTATGQSGATVNQQNALTNTNVSDSEHDDDKVKGENEDKDKDNDKDKNKLKTKVQVKEKVKEKQKDKEDKNKDKNEEHDDED